MRRVAALLAGVFGCSSGTSSPFTSADAGLRDAAVARMDAPSAGDDVHGYDIQPFDVTPVDAATAATGVLVYAHTSDSLYAIDPTTLAVTEVAPFAFPDDGQNHQMTDIAVTASDQIWGVTFDTLYQVDRVSAECSMVAALSGTVSGADFNGLTFVPAGVLGSAEVLVAATVDGSYFLIDTTTGAVDQLGSYGNGIGSSGDMVAVAGVGMYATVTQGSGEYLAHIDERSGAATIIGPTGFTNTWGLGYWRARIYGFTDDGQFVTIDPATGAGTMQSTSAQMWWGAGVTTVAPTSPP